MAHYLAGHPDLEGMRSLGHLWSSVRRPDVFRINVRNLLEGFLGRRDHLFEAIGLRRVISQADLGFARLEEAPLPVHVVATDVVTGAAVVLSDGDATDALMASSAIPGIFPPVTVGGRMLVDGGVLANLPVSQAIEIGATRVYVLPAIAGGIGSMPSGAIDMMQRSMMIATAALGQRDLDEARGCAEVHVVPVPTAAQLSIFDFGETQVLMEGAYLSTAAWLRQSERELAR